MAFYTPLTLYVAIENPVTDCGCFGEALVITNWQTFWKNVVLLVLIIVVLATHKLQRIRLTNTPSWILTGLFFAISIAFSAYCLHYLPIIDFRPYKIGANIAEGMEIPENAPRDEYKTTFIYEKNGIEKEFTLQDYPWQDTTWHFVDQRSELIRAGYVPPIHDFSVTTMDGDDITSDVLTSDEICLIIMYDLQKTDTQNLQKVFEFANNRAIDGAEVLALTASYEGEIERFKEQTRMPWRFCATDPIQLKTIVRANPGIVVLKKGVVVEKYSHTQL